MRRVFARTYIRIYVPHVYAIALRRPRTCHGDLKVVVSGHIGHLKFFLILHTDMHILDPQQVELKRAHKTAVKEEKRERRKSKVPKHIKKRKEKLLKQRHSK